jgi:hypothetical protein
MSGSGGGSGYDPGGPKDCQLLSIKTQLASPKAAVIAKLKVGDVLDVELTRPAGPVQVITSGGEIAGAILSPDVAKLIECISDDHEYQAKVLEIKGGNCQVLITHT